MAEVLSRTNLLFQSCNDNQQFSKIATNPFALRSSLRLGVKDVLPQRLIKRVSTPFASINTQIKTGGYRIGKLQKWWEKGLQPNIREVDGAQDLVDSLLKAGDKLVVVDFFSPGCGGCRTLHPKICQLAEMNPDVEFLEVNYEEHKSMCYSLNVHVLPFFRFYRGAHGRLCSFSCTNATIKKFKDALGKHTPERCSLGPTKGLEEKELLALAGNRELNFNYTPKPVEPVPILTHQESTISSDVELPRPLGRTAVKYDEKNLVTARR